MSLDFYDLCGQLKIFSEAQRNFIISPLIESHQKRAGDSSQSVLFLYSFWSISFLIRITHVLLMGLISATWCLVRAELRENSRSVFDKPNCDCSHSPAAWGTSHMNSVRRLQTNQIFLRKRRMKERDTHSHREEERSHMREVSTLERARA